MGCVRKLYIDGHYDFVEDLADALGWVELSILPWQSHTCQDEVEKRVRDVVGCVERAQTAIEKAIMKLERR